MRIFIAALLALLLVACGRNGPSARLNVGDIAPSFRTLSTDGTPVHFPAAWAGRPLVICFWADWCKSCETEMKVIEPVYRRLQPRGLQVVAVNAGQDRATVTAFMRKHDVSYSALLDENSAIARAYGVVGLPVTYFLDASGVVRVKLIGEADAAGFERAALQVLNDG